MARGAERDSVDAKLVESIVIDTQVMGEFVDDGDPDLVGQVVRIRKVGLEGQAEQ